MPRGGKREGAGRKKGQETLDKEAAREMVRQKVYAELGPLVDAQISNAKGISYLVVRQKSTGKFMRVGELRAREHNADLEVVEVWEKDPSIMAFSDLLNRAIDKPKEQEQEIKLTGDADLIAKLVAGRKRAAASRQPVRE